jgi:hypothetical protein
MRDWNMDVANCEERHLASHVNFIGCRFTSQSAVEISSDKQTCDQQELCAYGLYFKQHRSPLW